MEKEKNVIDLFCGAGGMSEGFSQAGFNIIAANDFLKEAADTFSFNHKGTKLILGDIEKISPKDFLKRCGIKKEEVGFVIGGPPCQGFSMANRQKMIDDPRNRLYKSFVNYVREMQPLIFIMENVKGIKSKTQEIIKDFSDIGYFSDYICINTKNFQIPQNRERIFFIGTNIKKGEEIIKRIFEIISSKKTDTIVPLKDALWGLRKINPLPKKNMTSFESKEFGFLKDNIINKNNPPEFILKINKGKIPKIVYNHKTRFNNKRDVEIFKRLPQGGKSDHPSIKDIMPYKKRNHIFKDKYYKLKEDSVSKTITAHMKYDCNMYIHPLESRGLTPREAARIQTFPDDYKFEGAFSKWYLQIGNAVPPMLGKIIGNSIITTIKEIKKDGH